MKNKELITKYLNHEAGDEEIQELKNWIDESEANKNEFAELKNSHAYVVSQLSSCKSNVDFNQIIQQTKPSKRLKKSIFRNYKIAASIFFPVLVIATAWLFYNQFQNTNQEFYTEVIAPPKHNSQVILPDGTHVWLSPESHLKYKQNFGEQKRTVELEGEGYFEVVKNTKKPFIVETENLNVTVLGTSFNVEAYSEDKLIRTTLVRGSVEIQSNKIGEKAILTPGDQFTFDIANNTASIEKVNTEIYRLVKDGLLIFKRNNLAEVCRKLERWYMVPIEYEDNGENNLLFTAKFEDESLETILKIVKETIPIQYQIKDNQIIVKSIKK
jgi:ferric-dicitrate binding protein FerR (iron transport regulator)